MADESNMKMEQDFTDAVDKLLPEAYELAVKVGPRVYILQSS